MKNKAFISGLLGGILGSGIVACGLIVYDQHVQKEEVAQLPQQETKVSNLEYNINTDATKIIDKVKGGVVSIVNLQKSSQEYGVNDQNLDTQDKLKAVGEGSGVIYKKDKNNAYVVTNNHVVANSDALQVILNNGQKLNATLVGRDEYTDLAVLKIKADKVETVLPFGNSNNIKVGESVLAIGSPLGSEYADSVTEGIISAKNRTITTKSEDGGTVSINAIQTDAAINPGNSGGPLINMAGQVIGINSIKISNDDNNTSVEGMGFSIPSNDAVNIINQLEKNGKIQRPALGITMINLEYVDDEQRKDLLKLPDEVTKGVVINKVKNDSPAKAAGIERYDVIVAVDGKEISSSTELQSQLYNKKIGDEMTLTIYHDGHKVDKVVKLNKVAESMK